MIVPLNSVKEEAGVETEFQNLKCGDVFRFHGEVYLALMTFTDKRHTQTIVPCIAQKYASTPLRQITCVRGFRTMSVPVLHHINMKLEVVNMEGDEVSQDAIDRLEAQLNRD